LCPCLRCHLTQSSEELGKQRGSDLVENKKTVITLHATEHGVDVEGLLDTDDPEEVSDAEIEDAVAELEAVGSIEYARDLADDLVEEGKDHLQVLPDNEARRRLEQVAEYLVERTY
jgi:geranylgeranyl diphosphate synthase type I